MKYLILIGFFIFSQFSILNAQSAAVEYLLSRDGQKIAPKFSNFETKLRLTIGALEKIAKSKSPKNKLTQKELGQFLQKITEIAEISGELRSLILFGSLLRVHSSESDKLSSIKVRISRERDFDRLKSDLTTFNIEELLGFFKSEYFTLINCLGSYISIVNQIFKTGDPFYENEKTKLEKIYSKLIKVFSKGAKNIISRDPKKDIGDRYISYVTGSTFGGSTGRWSAENAVLEERAKIKKYIEIVKGLDFEINVQETVNLKVGSECLDDLGN